jgi:hypothetical protein
MHRLRVTQSDGREDNFRIDLDFESNERPRRTVASTCHFECSYQDNADLRWYLEEYLQYPQNPAPTIAARIEQRMAEIGAHLFSSVFYSNDDARDMWAELLPVLNETRVEVTGTVDGATAIPWELMRDPKTDVWLALRAAVFVRTQPNDLCFRCQTRYRSASCW